MLNTDSDATVVTGMLSKSQDIIERCGNLGLLVSHQSSTSICVVRCKNFKKSIKISVKRLYFTKLIKKISLKLNKLIKIIKFYLK